MKPFPKKIFRAWPSLALALLAGCASTTRDADKLRHDAERVRAETAKGRYWSAQAAQQPAPVTSTPELIPLTLSERIEDGVIRTPSVEFLRLPRTP